MSEKKWVDFKVIKQKVTMEMVLVRYGLLDTLKQTSKGFKGPCPIHKGTHPNQFHVDPVKNRWNCFAGCPMENYEGHVIGFVAAMEGVELRDAALLIAEWFNLDTSRPNGKKQESAERPAAGGRRCGSDCSCSCSYDSRSSFGSCGCGPGGLRKQRDGRRAGE